MCAVWRRILSKSDWRLACIFNTLCTTPCVVLKRMRCICESANVSMKHTHSALFSLSPCSIQSHINHDHLTYHNHLHSLRSRPGNTRSTRVAADRYVEALDYVNTHARHATHDTRSIRPLLFAHHCPHMFANRSPSIHTQSK